MRVDEQIADERAFEAHLLTLGNHDDLERLRAALHLQPTDEEEARPIFGRPLDTEDFPIVGIDVDRTIGPILVRYCPRRLILVVRSAQVPSARRLYDMTLKGLQHDYAEAKLSLTRYVEWSRQHPAAAQILNKPMEGV